MRRIPGPETVQRGLGSLDRALVAVDNPPFRMDRITLSPADGYILSRADGSTTARSLIQASPLPAEDVERSLLGLLSTGVVRYLPATPKPAQAPSARRSRAARTRRAGARATQAGRPLAVPVGHLLIRRPERHERRLGEGAPEELQRDRQAVAAEAHRQRERRQAGQVAGGNRGRRPRRARLRLGLRRRAGRGRVEVLADGWREPRAGRGDERVVARQQRVELGAHRDPRPHRVDVVDGRRQQAREAAHAVGRGPGAA